MRMVADRPIEKLGAALIVFRLAGVAVRYLVQGGAPFGARLTMFATAAAFHVGALLLIVAAFQIGVALAPRRRQAIGVVAAAIFAVLMIAGQADLTVASITGAPLTPTVFRTYRGIRVVSSSEFLEPLRANWQITVAGTLAFLALVGWMAGVLQREGRRTDAARARPRRLALTVAGAVVLMLAPALAPGASPPPPIELAFTREYLGLDGVTLHEPEQDAVRELRRVVGLPPGMKWMSDEYPLVYGRADGVVPRSGHRADLPDIVVVMVESLRGDALGLTETTAESATPNLDALARRSVVVPAFTSNGFPSAPSVLSFHCSAWPHRRKEIITDFSNRRFDNLPGRLRDFDYDTRYIGADPHFDHQDVWLSRWYASVTDLVARGETGTDRAIVSSAIDEIRRHDAAASPRPLFAFVSTYSTHYPFRLPPDNDEAGEAPLPPSAGLPDRYRQTLRYTDRQLGALVAFLDSRPRRDRTLLLVLGDHGFYTDLRRTSGVPTNDTEWTVAMFSGPEALIGGPRHLTWPASHVDMLPTLLALVGDERPSASLGTNLFGPPRSGVRYALSVRPGGLRFDRDGYSVIVDARTPGVTLTSRSFPDSLEPAGRTPADVDAAHLNEWVDAWSYLVEHNRVWNDAFLDQ
jgi:arylsulfatase A-like enzyme